jgi:hypothetical protein
MLQKLLNAVKEWGRIGKIWGWKGVQCLIMGELKQIRKLSLKYLVLASLKTEASLVKP